MGSAIETLDDGRDVDLGWLAHVAGTTVEMAARVVALLDEMRAMWPDSIAPDHIDHFHRSMCFIAQELWPDDYVQYRKRLDMERREQEARRALSRPVSKEDRAAVFQRDEHKCRTCGATERLTIDHIVPRRRGGTNARDNLQTLCVSCNSRKGARVPERA
jgi:hypothetical protein